MFWMILRRIGRYFKTDIIKQITDDSMHNSKNPYYKPSKICDAEENKI